MLSGGGSNHRSRKMFFTQIAGESKFSCQNLSTGHGRLCPYASYQHKPAPENDGLSSQPAPATAVLVQWAAIMNNGRAVDSMTSEAIVSPLQRAD
jgi:hypothetical protein